MRFRNGFTGKAVGAHPYSVSTLPSTSCALGLSFSRGWDASWRTVKSQIHPRAVSGQDLDPGTDPAGDPIRSQWNLSLTKYCHITLFLFSIMSLKKTPMICTQCIAAYAPGGFPGSLCTLINNDLPYHHSNLFIQHQGAGMLPCRQK